MESISFYLALKACCVLAVFTLFHLRLTGSSLVGSVRSRWLGGGWRSDDTWCHASRTRLSAATPALNVGTLNAP